MNLKKIGLFALAMIMTLFSFQTYSFAAEEREWVKKEPMPTARYNVGSIVYDDKIYVYGGTPGHGSFANLEVYDPAKDAWETLPSSFHARGAMAFVENQGKFYAIGGAISSDRTNIVEVFDPVSNKWTSAQSMPTPLRFANAVSLDNTIYTFGGIEKGNESTNLVYSFNPNTNSWVSKNSMPFKAEAQPFIINNSIYVIHNDFDEKKISIYLYDHLQDSWTLVDELLDKNADSNCIIYNDKIIFYSSSTLYSYDFKTKKLETYSLTTSIRGGLANSIVNGKLYLIGGTYVVNGYTSGPTSDVEELNLSDLVNPDPEPNPNPDPNPDPDPNPNPNPDPNPNPTGNALLVIYMDSGLIKEYEMTNEEIRNFTEWYEGRAKGNGREAYIVNKKYNIGPFNSRKDFISYSHIESFEVQEYSR
ncbi:kelch repeat protein [Brevibacillus phage Jimmer1]|uniref:Kelch repeat protein n=4 Tax=Jimmervirus TaxID=1984788 RepID=S5MBI3_9CAUD|nr:galactose oxidase [Brevibacillus phage Osiris]YP_009226355.1 galactose oxidase [Brevibacillus phage Jimmer1]YP_009606472.1 galactose oxidase [Brevibacillus phage Jimmer2]ALA48057.1 putative kelch repeat protein [Brevibacillus phage Powder]AGR47184.1 kelch repeat protein [Brevibacillus phage Jimmer2]AGR47286.1 kelch repeat protein [Brevibacillus phage Jimmer1]ALA07315.1 putative kelch repeat protein [Brevibacillus phage Osiris]